MCVKVSAQVKVYFYEDDYILWIGKRFHIHNQVIYDKCLFLLEKWVVRKWNLIIFYIMDCITNTSISMQGHNPMGIYNFSVLFGRLIVANWCYLFEMIFSC